MVRVSSSNKNDHDTLPANKCYGDIEEIEDELEKRFRILKPFDTIPYPPYDHYFINYKRWEQFFLGRTLENKIFQEWRLLESNLSNSIFVRAYNNRVDLMRAVIIGPPGTPYTNGLFFFDILIPKNYPDCPPKFFYHSYGFDLNPCLNVEGKVYLSLIEPWMSRFHSKYSKWNPKQSSVLDVLVSIQRLLLSNKPCYDDPFGFNIYMEEKSEEYNKNVFLSMCEGMIRMLESPPNGFKIFVEGHFLVKAHAILMECKNYRDDKSALQLFNMLIVFERNGTYCKHHLRWMKLPEAEMGQVLEKSEKKENRGFVCESLNYLKNQMQWQY